MAMVISFFILVKRRENQPINAPKWDVKGCKELGKALLKLSLPS
jgi:hypothetical protein